jgi:hypothetical protein
LGVRGYKEELMARVLVCVASDHHDDDCYAEVEGRTLKVELTVVDVHESDTDYGIAEGIKDALGDDWFDNENGECWISTMETSWVTK